MHLQLRSVRAGLPSRLFFHSSRGIHLVRHAFREPTYLRPHSARFFSTSRLRQDCGGAGGRASPDLHARSDSQTPATMLELSAYDKLRTHTRFLVSLRSAEGVYHQLILFRLSRGPDAALGDGAAVEPAAGADLAREQMYAMEAACPHLGADMSHADIEECETGVVAVCPWHRYDFDLQTGKSETGLRACTYRLELREADDGSQNVWVESPEGGTQWRVVELRPVSEDFADPPPSRHPDTCASVTNSDPSSVISTNKVTEDIVPTPSPTTLIQWAVLILNTPDPVLKVERTRHAVKMFQTGKLASVGHHSPSAPVPPAVPSREEQYIRNSMDPSKMGSRKNRVVMLHALANIEQWAIDLAWDMIARFGPSHKQLPPAFFSDWAKVALDESKHFSLLNARLQALGTVYGSLPVHAGLWESATDTAHSLRARLAIIHLVHEARGLDVNPQTIARFARQGDQDSVRVLEVIHADEVTHVTAGHRWFTWCCKRDGVEPVATFRAEVRKYWRGDIKPPFNTEDRERAGMTKAFYENIKRGE